MDRPYLQQRAGASITLAMMTRARLLPAFSNGSSRAVALFCAFALGGGLEVLNDGRPFPARLLGTWQEEEESKGAKGRDEVNASHPSLARRRGPRLQVPPQTARRPSSPDIVATAGCSVTRLPLRSGAGQFQRC
jgi:hypothetical protein